MSKPGLAAFACLIAGLACSAPPELGSIVAIRRDGAPRCLGAVVHEGWVLTAKHCVTDLNEDHPNDARRFRVSNAAGVRAVERVHIVAGIYQHLGDLQGRDVALLELDGTLGTPAAVARGPTRDEPVLAVRRTSAGVFGLGAGLGVAALLGPEPVLVPTPIVAVDATQLYSRNATCDGDSGGPLFRADGGGVLGVASWRTAGACGEGLSAFIRVDGHVEWMERVVGAALRSGTPAFTRPPVSPCTVPN